MAEWYYVTNGQQQGPVELAALKELAARGTLLPADLIWRDGLTQWTAAEKIAGVFDDVTYLCATCQGAFGRDQAYNENGTVICKTCYANRAAALVQRPQQLNQLAAAGQPANAQQLGYAGPMSMGVGMVSYGSPQHQLTSFPVAAVVLLDIFTNGMFGVIYWNLMHGSLPVNRIDDPSAGKAVGFCFIPFFNFYWIFFSYLRLFDRINEQRMMRGLPPVQKGLITTALILQFAPIVVLCVPLLGILLFIVCLVASRILAVIAWAGLQAGVNELVLCSGGQPAPAYHA